MTTSKIVQDFVEEVSKKGGRIAIDESEAQARLGWNKTQPLMATLRLCLIQYAG